MRRWLGRSLIALLIAAPFFGLGPRADATTICLTPTAPIFGPALGEICIPLPD